LAADGFPIWSVKGFEADDLIATAVTIARAKGHEALIVSADKDLLQLVGGR
jgi:DNA polymerase-1